MSNGCFYLNEKFTLLDIPFGRPHKLHLRNIKVKNKKKKHKSLSFIYDFGSISLWFAKLFFTFMTINVLES